MNAKGKVQLSWNCKMLVRHLPHLYLILGLVITNWFQVFKLESLRNGKLA